MKNSERPAFVQCVDTNMKKSALAPDFNYGLTKREYFAAMAMQGILSQSLSDEKRGEIGKEANGLGISVSEFIMQGAVRAADQLLSELEK